MPSGIDTQFGAQVVEALLSPWVLALLGLCIGSFLNVVIHRLPMMMEREWRLDSAELLGVKIDEPAPITLELPFDLFNLDMSHALKLALERERDSESYYRFMAERVPNTELGRLFMELAETEWKHKTDLQRAYDTTLMNDPEQFLLDI